jgi:hypothetical protein
MTLRRSPARPQISATLVLRLACATILLFALSIVGCKHASHTSDYRLTKIDDMLSAQLPNGTPRARVEYFLTSRGYKTEDSPDKSSLVAIVRHVDTDTLIPATARVTFRFDSGDKLASYELLPAPDAPLAH